MSNSIFSVSRGLASMDPPHTLCLLEEKSSDNNRKRVITCSEDENGTDISNEEEEAGIDSVSFGVKSYNNE